jgi:type IV pilus assembly protein PilE
VLAIVAILVALALPSFTDVVRKARRSDAMNAILTVHLAQERWRANHFKYGDIDELDLDGAVDDDKMPSPDEHYNITIPANAETSYTIVGTALGDQINDSCGNFTLTFTVGIIAKTATGDDDLCWKK